MLALVVHARTHRRGIRGLPGRSQRHAETRDVGGALAGRALAVQVVDQAGDHQLFFFEQGTAHRFGRMRGEHGFDIDAGQPVGQFLQADALGLELDQRRMQAIGLRRAAGALVIAAAADAMHALGDVDHLEIGAEGPDQGFGVVRLEARQQSGQRGAAVRCHGDGKWPRCGPFRPRPGNRCETCSASMSPTRAPRRRTSSRRGASGGANSRLRGSFMSDGDGGRRWGRPPRAYLNRPGSGYLSIRKKRYNGPPSPRGAATETCADPSARARTSMCGDST